MLHLKQILWDHLSQNIQYFTVIVNTNMMGWYFSCSLITNVKLISFAEEMGYYCLKYFERIWSFKTKFFHHSTRNNKNFKEQIYFLTKIVLCHQRRAASCCLSGSSNDWLVFEGWERRGITWMAGEGPCQPMPILLSPREASGAGTGVIV